MIISFDTHQYDILLFIIYGQWYVENLSIDQFCGNDKKLQRESSIIQLHTSFKGVVIDIQKADYLEHESQAFVNTAFDPLETPLGKRCLRAENIEWKTKLQKLSVGEIMTQQTKSRYVLHAKLPQYDNKKDLFTVFQIYIKCLEKASELGLKSIVFTEVAQSCFQIPKQFNAGVLVKAIIIYIEEHFTNLQTITFISNDKQICQLYTYELEKQLDEQKHPEMLKKSNETFFKFINNETFEEYIHVFSTGLASGLQDVNSSEQLS